MLPKSLYSHDDDICYSGRPFTARQHLDCLKFHNKQSLEHPTFTFQNSYFTTKEFNEWWYEYYQLFNGDSFSKKLNVAFDQLEKQLTISKYFFICFRLLIVSGTVLILSLDLS